MAFGESYKKIQSRYRKVRTIRFKTDSGFFIRSIQRIYPLEMKAKEINSLRGMSRSNDTEGQTECDDQSSSHQKILELALSGRLIKVPKRLDILNQGINTLQSLTTYAKWGRNDVG